MIIRKWFREHSLSLVLLVVFLAFLSAYATVGWKWDDFWLNMAADTYGGLVIVFATKYFYERGSPESK